MKNFKENFKVAFNKAAVCTYIALAIIGEVVLSFVLVLGADELLYSYVDSYTHIDAAYGLVLVLGVIAYRIMTRIPRWAEKLQ